jgi:uncharacterized protein YegJ (DUF2314 family)
MVIQMRRIPVLWLISLVTCGCGGSEPSTLFEGDYAEEEMSAAILRAQSEVEIFIQDLSSQAGTGHAVKVPIREGSEVEHFWLTDVQYSDGVFQGQIGNEPGVVGNVKFGQAWRAEKGEISDWMFFRDGKMHGNYTVRPLLKSMSPHEANQLRSMFAVP